MLVCSEPRREQSSVGVADCRKLSYGRYFSPTKGENKLQCQQKGQKNPNMLSGSGIKKACNQLLKDCRYIEGNVFARGAKND